MNGYYDPASYCAQRSVGYLIKRCAALLTERAEQVLTEQGVNFTQWVILMQLRRNPGAMPAELAREIGHDQGAMTRAIDSLEQAGLLRRNPSPRDRRAIELHLTAAGRRYVESQIPMVIEALNDLLADFSHAEIDQLVALLQRLLDRLLQAKRG